MDDEDPAEPQRPLLGPIFWVVIATSMVFVAAGAGVALLGPALFADVP